MMRALALLVMVGCAGSADGADISDASSSDALPPGCTLGITYSPSMPIAGVDPIVRAVAHVTGAQAGSHTYRWVLLRNGLGGQPPLEEFLGGAEVEFSVNEAVYTIAFSLDGEPECLQASELVDVNAPGTQTVAMRAHVVTADPLRPPLVKSVIVEGGDQDVLAPIQLSEAVTVNGNLQLGNTNPVAGYLKFMPGVGPEAVVETFANPLGDFQIQVRSETHDVLVIPSTPNVPPQIVTWQAGQSIVTLADGQLVTGTVLDPAGAGLQGANVQLTIDGVPSTVGTSGVNGGFQLHVMPKAGAAVRIEVTPPSNSGLPRLVAESTAFDPAQPIAASYVNTLTTKSLSGTTLSRGGGLANASITIVGTIPNAGTISTGTPVTAAGEVRLSATANGSGVLPANFRAPSFATLTAVIFPNVVGDHAVTALDLSGAVPGTINAAPLVAQPTQLRESTNTTALPGAVLDAVPVGVLALAGAPTIRKTADASGNLTISLAPNANYQVRLSDPNGNRAAQRIVPNVTSSNLAATQPLLKATKVQGVVEGQSAIPGAIVQFLCATCTGLDRSRPIAEGITGIDGRYSLAVPDPN